jgi:hypothetical protein
MRKHDHSKAARESKGAAKGAVKRCGLMPLPMQAHKICLLEEL